jgi:cbb3-type cytochrome oxidase maturation protein
MESLFLLIPVAIVFCAIAIKLLLWAIDSGQYDDLDKESWRILNDETPGETTAGRVRRDETGEAGTIDATAESGDGKPRSGSAP